MAAAAVSVILASRASQSLASDKRQSSQSLQAPYPSCSKDDTVSLRTPNRRIRRIAGHDGKETTSNRNTPDSSG